MKRIFLCAYIVLVCSIAYGDVVSSREFVAELARKYKYLTGPEDECRFEIAYLGSTDDGASVAMVSDDSGHYSDGATWWSARRDKNGEIFCSGMRYGDSIGVFSRTRQLYRFQCIGQADRIWGRDIQVSELHATSGGQYDEKLFTQDALISISSNGLFVVEKTTGGASGVLDRPSFARLSRLASEWYCGYDFVRKQLDSEPGGKYGPKGSLEPLGGIVKPDGVESFLEGMAKGEANSTTNRYRAVFADVDNDGDADFYLASDGDKRGAGMWHWRLYLNEKGAFVPAKEPIRIGKGSSASVMIDCEVDAGTNDFYRVVRKDILPTVEVFLSDGDRLHSRSFYRLTTPMERKQKGGESFGDWSMGYASAHDCPGPLDFDDLVSWPWFHSLERLPCETFAVPREMISGYDVYGEECSNRISTTHNEL